MSFLEFILGNPGPNASFPTGSALVNGVTPSDLDFVCLFSNEAEMVSYAKSKGISSPDNGYEKMSSRFICARKDEINYICTCDVELFYRFKAYSGVLSLLQESNKEKRIDLAKACLYWNPK